MNKLYISMKSKLPILAAILIAALVLPVVAQNYRGNTTAKEIAALPKYCYAQYVSGKLSADPQYSIQGCGAYTNHYCPGLVDLMRAQNPKHHKSERREFLRSARTNFKYTLEHTPPNCWLRPEAERALEQADAVAAQVH